MCAACCSAAPRHERPSGPSCCLCGRGPCICCTVPPQLWSSPSAPLTLLLDCRHPRGTRCWAASLPLAHPCVLPNQPLQACCRSGCSPQRWPSTCRWTCCSTLPSSPTRACCRCWAALCCAALRCAGWRWCVVGCAPATISARCCAAARRAAYRSVGTQCALLPGRCCSAWLHSPLDLQVGYGATILSFLGGVHWGLAMTNVGGEFRPVIPSGAV